MRVAPFIEYIADDGREGVSFVTLYGVTLWTSKDGELMGVELPDGGRLRHIEHHGCDGTEK